MPSGQPARCRRYSGLIPASHILNSPHERSLPTLNVASLDPRPWGTTDLSPIYPNHRFEKKIGEAWLTGDDGKVANGPLRGKSLAELSTEYGRALVGEAANDPIGFRCSQSFFSPMRSFRYKSIPMTKRRAKPVNLAVRLSAGTWRTPSLGRRLL